MRTTIELPPELMQAAKLSAARHGESLKELFTRAVERELHMPPGRGRRAGRVSFPLIGQDAQPRVDVTNADIAAAFDAEDVERYRA